MNRNRWIPLAAAAAVVLVVSVVAGVSTLSGAGRAAGPPMLRLAAAEGSDAAYGSLLSAAQGPIGPYRLIGTLPSGPSEARVRNLPSVVAPVALVRDLASALGETAAPVRVASAWKAGELVVTDEPGNPWTFGTACGPDTPVSSDGGTTNSSSAPVCSGSMSSSGTIEPGMGSSGTASSGTASPAGGSSGTIEPDSTEPNTGSGTVGACPGRPPGTEPAKCEAGTPVSPEWRAVTKAQALAATATVRGALGLRDAPTRVEGHSVVVEPLVSAVPTNGMATVLQLSSDARLVGASGYLSTGHQGDLYPLRSARKAFDTMPVIALGMPCDAAAGCPEGPAITGARLGLNRVALVDGAAALVPAWLFTVQDSPVPLVALAVADQFLGSADPTEPGIEPGPGPSTEPGAGPGTEPGTVPSTKPGTEPSIEPGPDGQLPPQPPSSDMPADPSGREMFGFDGAYADADPNVLVVRYGDSGSCPSLAVRHDVVQQPDRIVVTLTRTPMPADRPCTSDYQAKLVRIKLTAPLGSREVIDGSRKVPVPISTGIPPFG